MTSRDIRGLIGLILLILALAILPAYKPENNKFQTQPTSKPQCDDFSPVDGAGRPAICDEK